MNNGTDAARYDSLMMYCRMLGHEVPFSYCRIPGQDLFCRKIADCWMGRIDIRTYLAETFTEEEIARASAPPAPKIVSLTELIRKAQEREDRA